MDIKEYSLINFNKIQSENSNKNIEYSNDGNNDDKTTAIRTKLCLDFFKSIFCIWDSYAHSIKQHSEYIKETGSTYSTLSICHTLSYSICCEEINFRDLPKNSRKDRLNRIVTNINAFIAALWSLSNQNNLEIDNKSFEVIESPVFRRDIIKKYSWDVIQRKILNNNSNNNDKNNNDDLKENEDEEKYCYDPFGLLCRGIICYPTTFTLNNSNTDDSEMLLKTIIDSTDYDENKSNVRMDIDEEIKTNDNNDNNDNDKTASDLYRLLLSCYIMQISQLAVSYCSDNTTDDIKEKIVSFIKNDDTKKELTEFITIRIIPFLRKSCLLYNSFGCIESLDDLWTSGIDENNMNELQIECDSLCDILYIPTISNVLISILDDNNLYFMNYICNINKNEIDYIIKKQLFWDKCKPFSLIPLPSSYNDLFQIAAISKCKNKNITPKFSAICLICGEYVCLSCCTFGIEQRGDATKHCLECNNGFGVFLWLQKSKLIIVWNNLGVLFKSVYLDKYGEEDCGLVRGNRITLNKERYYQLCQIITHHKIPNKLVQLRKTNRDLLERVLAL